MKGKILILAHDFPYPPNHGGRYDMYYRIEALSKLGFDIYSIFTVKKKPTEIEMKKINKHVKKSYIKKRKVNIFDFFKIIPYQVLSRKLSNTELKHLKEEFKLPQYFDFILLEDFYVISIFEQLIARKLIKFSNILYRIHNNNIEYFLDLAKASPLKWKVYYLTEAFKIFIFERKFLKKYKPIKLFISYEDYIKFKENGKSFWIPPAVNIKNLTPYISKNLKEFNILFVGNLFTVNNIHGIRWFIKNIHPILINKIPEYNLIIAGKLEKSNPLMDLIKKTRKIKLFINPQDLKEIYLKSHIFISPIFFGAGVKIKNIDAIINGLPVISTLKGNEGTGLIPNNHILIARSIKEWIFHIENLYKHENLRKELVEKAQRFIVKNYDQIKILGKLFNSLDKIEM